jgi:hypothetical protein
MDEPSTNPRRPTLRERLHRRLHDLRREIQSVREYMDTLYAHDTAAFGATRSAEPPWRAA